MPEPPRTGDMAPPFALASTEGEVTLDALLADYYRLVLAFYSEDGTSTCTTAIAMLKDAHAMITEFRACVLGVSADSVDAHRVFIEQLGGLPFALASDASLDVARAYGVVDEGDPRRSRRAIFVIGHGGTVMLAIPHFQPANLSHVEAIFGALGAEV